MQSIIFLTIDDKYLFLISEEHQLMMNKFKEADVCKKMK